MRYVTLHIVLATVAAAMPATVCPAQEPFGVSEVLVEAYEAQMTAAMDAGSSDIASSKAETAEGGGDETGESVDAEVAKRKKERLAQINKLVFDRRPSAILKLWAEPPKEEDDEPVEATADNQTDSKAAANESTPDGKAGEPKENDQPEQKSDLTPEERAKAKQEAEDKAKKEAEAKAKAAAAAKEKKLFDETLKLLTRSVTLGQWEQFGKLLANRQRLEEEEAKAAYQRMIAQLGSQVGLDFDQVVGLSPEMRQFMQSMMNNRRNNPAREYSEKHVLDFSDLAAIIRVAPTALEDQQMMQLASLLRMALQAGNPLEDFLAAARDGDLLPKQKVAVLLSAASRDDATAEFLPSADQAKAAGNAKALNLLARHYMHRYKKEQIESLREQAWDVTLAALQVEKPKLDEKTPDVDNQDADQDESDKQDVDKKKAAKALQEYEQARSEALTRTVSLAPVLREELGKQWLKDSFTKHSERGKEILAKLGTATAQRLAQMPQDSTRRQQNLELQSAAVEAFFATQPEIDAQWSGILNLLASNWLKEAGVSQQHSRSSRYGPSMQRDRYGNIYYVDPSTQTADNDAPVMALRRVNPVKVNKILETAPQGRWFDAIEAGLQPQYTMMLCRLWLKINEEEKAFPYIELLADTHPDTARELSEEFLRVWTSNHNPNQQRQRTNYYMFMYGYDQKADKIPLTRSKQQRNLAELTGWVERLRRLPLEDELNENLLVQAFMTCHSVAEVFDVKDIEEVFGTWGTIEAGTMARLIQQMRTNLAGLWRDPNVQRDAKTNRKKQDIQAEVVRGYGVAKQVLQQALEQHPDDWQLALAKACVIHDENDFLQEVAVSSEFSERRQEAFDVFARAAGAYVSSVADLPERDQKNDVFDHWFYAALGATDLRGISEKNRPVDAQIDLLADALNSIPGEVGKKHRDRFANALFTRMSAVNPACKFRYLEAGFKLVGDDPQAEEARKVYDYYKDLVTELDLVVRIDGDSQVGHTQPFGVYVDLKHTKELERESGGFAKYLQNQNQRYYSYNYGRPTENYRDKFQDAATAALQDKFEVLSITFNHPETKSRALDDSDWRITPYAHLLLKSRGPEVDKLPALKIDLDFLDTSGYVVLPINASPIAIDSSSGQAGAQASKVSLVQVLDERQAADGKLIVEAKVTARGMIPPLDDVLDTAVDGFELVDTEDTGVSIVEFDTESVQPVVLSERTWTLAYAANDPSAAAPKSFRFPEPIIDAEEVSYQRYVDADLEEVDQLVMLVQDYGSNRRAWTIGILCGLAALIVLLGGVYALRRRDSGDIVIEDQPVVLTPFHVLARLKQVESEATLQSEQRRRLADDITAIESHYFAESNGAPPPDLREIAAKWGMPGSTVVQA